MARTSLILTGAAVAAILAAGSWLMLGGPGPAPVPVPSKPAPSPDTHFSMLHDAQTLGTATPEPTPSPQVAAIPSAAPETTPTPAPAASHTPTPEPVAIPAPVAAPLPPLVPTPAPIPTPASVPTPPPKPKPSRPAATPSPMPSSAPTQTALVAPPAPKRFDGTYAGRTVAHGCETDRMMVAVTGEAVTITTPRGVVQGTLGADGALSVKAFENARTPVPLMLEGRFTDRGFAGTGSAAHCQFDFDFVKN